MKQQPVSGLNLSLRFLDSCVSRYLDGVFPPVEQPGTPGEWQKIAILARQNGLTPLIGYMINQGVPELDSLPERIIETFLRDYKESTIRNVTIMDQAERTLSLFRLQGIKAFLVKGGAILETIYRDTPGIRPVTDIDIVVAADDFERAASVLSETGASARGFRPPNHQLMVWSNSRNVPVDLHGCFFQTRLPLGRAGFRLPEKLFSRHSEGFTGRLGRPQHLFYLVYHALQHSLSRLIWWMDIISVIRQCSKKDMAVFEDILTESAVNKVFSSLLWVMKRRLGVSIPENISCLSPDIGISGRLALARTLQGRYPRRLNLLLYLACLPSSFDKIQFLKASLFPAAATLAGTYPESNRRAKQLHHLEHVFRFMKELLDMVFSMPT